MAPCAPNKDSVCPFYFLGLSPAYLANLSTLPPAHTDLEAQGLAQETFPRLEGRLVGLEFVAAEDGGDDEGEFHL